MIRKLLYALFVCEHPHQMKVRDDQGRLLLECLDCGNVAEALSLTTAERRKQRKQFPSPQPSKAQRTSPSKVERIEERRR